MAYEFDPVVPESTESIYQRELARMIPDIKKQRSDQLRFLQNQMQRMGVVNPTQTASRSIAPFAGAIGQAGAGAAVKAEEVGRRERETAERLNIQREAMQLKEEQWEEQLAEMVAGRQQSGMFNLFQYTGLTPEILKSSGLESLLGGPGGVSDWRQFQRELGRYNLPGEPFGGGGPGHLTAAQQLQLSKFYPGASRSYKSQAAKNWGWLNPGQYGY